MSILRKNKKADAIEITVARTGGKSERYVLNGDRTVEEALQVAGLRKKESEVIQVNGEEVDDLDYELEDGDRVILIKNIEGGEH